MQIVSWNVNSIGARLDRVLAFCDRVQPDVLCLQETKCLESAFPYTPFQERGWHCAVVGQKAYNGVAIISRMPLTITHRNLGSEDFNSQARFIACNIGTLTICSAYVPNGQSVGSDKYQYKLAWLKNLQQWIAHQTSSNLIIAGDFNIAPTDIDVHDPVRWQGSILCSEPERSALRSILEQGLMDTFRSLRPSEPGFTWWDYRQLAFPKNRGLRIDLILADKQIGSTMIDCNVDRNERKGSKPSDHAPLILQLKG